MTTLEPGAREVFTHGRRVRPLARALRASRPAATITSGLDVLVQLVMAAMTTRPWSRLVSVPSERVTSTLCDVGGAWSHATWRRGGRAPRRRGRWRAGRWPGRYSATASSSSVS